MFRSFPSDFRFPASADRFPAAVLVISEAPLVHINRQYFNAAYKTDDGALSWGEFKAFFSDGILSNEDLEKLFHDIDTHKTK